MRPSEYTHTDKNTEKEALVDGFGKVKGQQYYGAIKELQNFLDPNVFNDKEFQLDEKTMDDLKDDGFSKTDW